MKSCNIKISYIPIILFSFLPIQKSFSQSVISLNDLLFAIESQYNFESTLLKKGFYPAEISDTRTSYNYWHFNKEYNSEYRSWDIRMPTNDKASIGSANLTYVVDSITNIFKNSDYDITFKTNSSIYGDVTLYIHTFEKLLGPMTDSIYMASIPHYRHDRTIAIELKAKFKFDEIIDEIQKSSNYVKMEKLNFGEGSIQPYRAVYQTTVDSQIIDYFIYYSLDSRKGGSIEIGVLKT